MNDNDVKEKTMSINKEELLNNGYQDILGTGGIFRKILKKGHGEKPEMGDKIQIKYNGYIYSTLKEFIKDEIYEYNIGECEVINAIELGGRLMHEGEICSLICQDRFGYGEIGCEKLKIASYMDLKFEIEFLKIIKRKEEMNEFTLSDLFKEIVRKKNIGNNWFHIQQYGHAIRLYKDGVKLFEKYKDDEKNEKGIEWTDLIISLGNNLANVQSKLNLTKEAIKSSKEVLEIDPENNKALYRLSHLYLSQEEYTKCWQYLKKGLQCDPNSKIFLRLMKEYKDKKEEYKKKEKKLYQPKSTKSKSSSESIQSKSSFFEKIHIDHFLSAGLLTLILFLVYYLFHLQN